MNKKLFYTQPTTDLLELRVEGLVCQSLLLNFDGESGTEVLISGGEENF